MRQESGCGCPSVGRAGPGPDDMRWFDGPPWAMDRKTKKRNSRLGNGVPARRGLRDRRLRKALAINAIVVYLDDHAVPRDNSTN